MTKIGIVSDIHLREEYHKEVVETVLDIKKEFRSQDGVAHTFVLGDLIQDSNSETDRKHVQQVRSIFDDWSSPVTYLLGNHDIENLSKEELSSILNQSKFYGTVCIGEQTFVYLDTTENGVAGRGRIGAEQRTWLDSSIPPEAVVLSHHPLGPFSLADNVWFQHYPERGHPWDRKEVLKILDGSTRTTIGGHIHQKNRICFQGMSHISVNAVSKETPATPVSGHYGILSVGDQIEFEWGCVSDSA